MQDSAHSMSKTMTGKPAFIAQKFNNLINTFLANRFTWIVPTNKYKWIMAGDWFELL